MTTSTYPPKYYQNLIKNGTANGTADNTYITAHGVPVRTKCIIMKYRTGTLYNEKHAIWFKHSINLTCRLCPQLDSALHSLPGCQNTQIRNMITERHNLACSMIFKAISKTGSLGSCFVSSWLCKIMRFLIQLKLRLYQSGSFHPASRTKTGLPPSGCCMDCSHLHENQKVTNC
jgi:hypothetical protein